MQLSPPTLPADTLNVAYNQTITATGGDGSVAFGVSNVQGAISGLNVPTNGGTGSLTINGTPTATGTETFTVTATDAIGDTASGNYSITVNSAVSLAPATLPADTVNVVYNQTITAGGGTGTLTLAVSNLQGTIPGLTVPTNGGTGSLTINGTPTAAGTETFTVTATDSVGGTASVNDSITVNPAVSLASATLPAGEVGVAYSQTIAGSGGTLPVTLAVSDIQGAIPGLMVPTSETGSLKISGTPTATGMETLTVTATDSVGATATANYSVTVNLGSQTITFDPIENHFYGDTFTPTATASSGLPVTLSVISGPAILNGNVLAVEGIGTITVEATQTGDEYYEPAPPVNESFTANKAHLTVTADNGARPTDRRTPR